jgi:hypothetical protein
MNLGFFRSLFLYIHLCCEIELGPKFRYTSLAITFIGSAGLLVLVLLLSGVSYHIGKLCYINFYRSRESLWGPILAVTSLSLVLQLLIMAHCIFHVVQPGPASIANTVLGYWRRRQSAESRGLPPSLPQTLTKRQALGRIVRILQMQWRATLIATLIVFHAAFMARALLSAGDATTYSRDEVMPWVICLLDSSGDKDLCLDYAARFGPSKELTMAAWTLLSVCNLSFLPSCPLGRHVIVRANVEQLSGFWAFVCVMRKSVAVAWVEYAREKSRAWSCASQRRGSGARSNSSGDGTVEQYHPIGSVAHASWQEEQGIKLDAPQTAHIPDSYPTSWPLRD